MARQFFNSTESRLVLAAVVLASVLLQLSTFGVTWLTQLIVDGALVKRNANPMTLAGLGALALMGGVGLVRLMRGWQMARLQAQIDSRVMHGFMAHMLSLPYRFFQERTNGDLLNRLNSNVNIRQAITSQTLSTILDGSLALGSLVVLIVLAPGIAALAVGVAALQIIITRLSVPRLRELSQQSMMARTNTSSYEVEMLNGMLTLKSSGADQEAFQHWSGLFTQSLNTDYTKRRFSALTEAVAGSLNTLVPIMLLWVGGWLVLSGQYSFGKMLAMNTLAATFISPINSLIGNIQELQMVGIYLDRVRDVLETAPEPTGTVIPNLRGPIELVNVSFRYDETSPCVVNNVSVVIEPGKKVALVGRTGSGKSTLGRLLLGLHRPTDGEVLIDGLPLDKADLHALRSSVGVVNQEPSIFSGSIRSNIAFNAPFIPLKTVAEAARIAEISEDIERMPMGYDTWLSENGNSLSGGQRQRVSIARALAHGPDVLLFDEATSHLDAVSERKIEQNLSQIPCTRIVIAHRLSTVRDADLILVLDKGAIVERGTHDELIRLGGKYAELVASQGNDSSRTPVPA
jgi:ABC-type bacteriocin/lantibiotic exporter with double-glycine peptidase domain